MEVVVVVLGLQKLFGHVRRGVGGGEYSDQTAF